MPTGSGESRTRRVFADWLERTGDYRLAAEHAGISERTGRRWKAQPQGSEAEPAERAALVGPTAILARATTFVGRNAALGDVGKCFAKGARVVSVLGPGGMGKTRLVARYAEMELASYAGGVYVCDLSSARTVEAVCAALQEPLGIAQSPRKSNDDLVAQVAASLAARGDVLVVLDNFEQAVGHAAATVGTWVATVPRARFLVTSRESLRVAGEVTFFLPALPEEEAAQLFCDRAALARPGFTMTDEDATRIAQLVRRLDGNPLAIELAASRMGVLSPAQLLERLEKRFDLLVRSTRDGSARQASMRAALDWSWDLLSPLERTVLAQISSFHGAFSLDAAEAVVDRGGDPGLVLDTLQGLKQRSLVVTDDGEGPVLFRLYDSVRDYAAEKLEGELRRQVTERHAAHFVEVFSGAFIEDFLAAARHSADDPAGAERALRAALAAAPWLLGRPQTLRAIYDRAIARGETYESLLGRVLVARAELERMLGDVPAAQVDLDRALTLAERSGDRGALGAATAVLGLLEHGAGRIEEATEHHAKALAIAREVGDAKLEAKALGNWAFTERLRRNTDRSMELAEQALALHRASGDSRLEADMQCVVATLHQARGDLDLARRSYEAALPVTRVLRDRAREAVVLGNLGTLLQELGELENARALLDKTARIFMELGMKRLAGIGEGNFAAVLFEMGHHAEARESYGRAIELLREAGDTVHEALFSAQRAGVLAMMDEVDFAEEALAHAEELLFPLALEDAIAPAAMLNRGHVELALARRKGAEGETEKADALRERVRARIDEAKTLPETDDTRFTLRMLVRAFELPSSPRALVSGLTVTTGAEQLRLPNGDVVSLEKRRNVRLVLERLVREREAAPGHPVTTDELLAAGWPGERVVRDAGISRVYVALNTLRKLGLKGVIVSRDGGYLLDPKVLVAVVQRL